MSGGLISSILCIVGWYLEEGVISREEGKDSINNNNIID